MRESTRVTTNIYLLPQRGASLAWLATNFGPPPLHGEEPLPAAAASDVEEDIGDEDWDGVSTPPGGWTGVQLSVCLSSIWAVSGFLGAGPFFLL